MASFSMMNFSERYSVTLSEGPEDEVEVVTRNDEVRDAGTVEKDDEPEPLAAESSSAAPLQAASSPASAPLPSSRSPRKALAAARQLDRDLNSFRGNDPQESSEASVPDGRAG